MKKGVFAGRYGHIIPTMVANTKSFLQEEDGFGAVGNIVSCKQYVEELLDCLQSIRKHCELIDGISRSNQLQRIDRLRSMLKSEALGTLDLAMRHTIREEFDSASALMTDFQNQLGKHRDYALKLLTLKESLDISEMPLEYVELFETGKMTFIGRIFLSYSMKTENDKLVEDLVGPFLEELGFQTIYAKKDFPPTKAPGQSAEDFIRRCGTLIAFLTKDQDSYPSANVIQEIGIASDKTVILIPEKGAHIPTNLKTSRTYFTFEHQHYGEMLLRLLRNLRLSGVLKSPRLYD